MGSLCMILVPSTHLQVNKGSNGKVTWCVATDHNKCTLWNVKYVCKKVIFDAWTSQTFTHQGDVGETNQMFAKQQCQIDNKCNILTKFQCLCFFEKRNNFLKSINAPQ